MSNLPSEIRKGMVTVHLLDKIPAKERTPQIAEAYAGAIFDTISSFDDLFDSSILPQMNAAFGVVFDLEDTIAHWERELNEPSTQVPRIRMPVNADTLSNALVALYTARASVMGGIEELGPVADHLNRAMKQAELVVKGVLATNNEWQGVATFYAMFPSDTLVLVERLRTVVDKLKARQSSLAESFSVMSRLITVRLGEPEEGSRRTNFVQDPVGSSTGDSFSKPGWMKK